MTFFQRFKRYLIGIAIGIILTGVFFKDRLSVFTSWLPGNIVKKEIYQSLIIYSDKATCQMSLFQISNKDFEEGLLEAKVVFSESSVRTTPRIYSLVSEDGKYKYYVQIEETQSTILSVSGDKGAGKCDNL